MYRIVTASNTLTPRVIIRLLRQGLLFAFFFSFFFVYKIIIEIKSRLNKFSNKISYFFRANSVLQYYVALKNKIKNLRFRSI